MTDAQRPQFPVPVEALYLSLKTFRRNGRGVATPVWFAADTQKLYVFSAGDAGKVKRLRRSSRAEVAVCDFRGNIKSDWCAATAELLSSPEDIRAAHRCLVEKYGWRARLLDIGAWIGGRIDKRAWIAISFGASSLGMRGHEA